MDEAIKALQNDLDILLKKEHYPVEYLQLLSSCLKDLILSRFLEDIRTGKVELFAGATRS